MSQTSHLDLEGEDDPGASGQRTQHDNSSNNPQPAPNQPLQAESIFGDSSGPLFSMYSKAAEEEDNRMVERWQKDADGILIFTGLFSAAVAALLAVTVQDLRPNSQDTSAFYLGNIYQVLADPNVTPSVPTPIAKPPSFSRPKYSVWVNSLWFLSLVMSLSCALWATSLHQWARRYIRLTQPARCSPEKRARIRAFFANGVDKMHVPWAVEGLPTLLHLSLFLFFGGLAIFLFNVDHDVFTCVLLWIVFFSIVYGLVTLLPFIRHDSPYNTPLSITARFLYWFLYSRIRFLYFRIQYLALKVFVHYRDRYYRRYSTRIYRSWRDEMERRLNRLKSASVEKKAEESVEEQSPEIDVRILDWTISALGDDDSLEKFFGAIPGFFNSKLVNHLQSHFPETVLKTFWGALDGFMDRTSSSNSVTESVKSRRDIICRDIMSTIPRPDYDFYADMTNPFNSQIVPHSHRSYSHFYYNEAPLSIEGLQTMARWCTHLSSGVSDFARSFVVWHLLRSEERDIRWIMLASSAYGVAADMHYMEMDVLFATLINVSREAIHSNNDTLMLNLVLTLTGSDIRPSDTLPSLQDDFCALWNELIQDARIPRYTPLLRRRRRLESISSKILRQIRYLYITLHPGTDAIFFPYIGGGFARCSPPPPLRPEDYPLCDIARHRQDSTPHVPVPISRLEASSLLTYPRSPYAPPRRSTSGGHTVSQQANQANIIQGPPSPSDPTASIKIGDNSQISTATDRALPVHTSSRPTDASPPSALRDIPPAATLSCSLEGTTLKDVLIIPCAEPDTSEILCTASTPAPTPTLGPVPESTPRVPDKTSISCDADAASLSNTLPPASSVVDFSIPASSPPSRVSPLPNAEFLALLDGTTPSSPIGNAALPHLSACGLVNNGSMCFANAVLQLLVYSPPFWNLVWQLEDLKGRRGGGQEPGGCATPLVDAMIRFFDEFVFRDKEPPPTQRTLQQPDTTKGKAKEGEVEKKDNIINKIMDSFEPTYLYEAMKENRQLKHLLDGKHEDAEEFLGLFLDALDRELVELQTYIRTHKPASVPNIEGFKGEVAEAKSAEGQIEVGKRDYTASSIESPISHIFGGRSRSTVREPNQPDTVAIEAWRSLKLYIQPDSVHTIQDALALVSQPQPVQVGPSDSSNANQEVLLEALPPVLVLHLERFLYDAAKDGIDKISKPVQFAPELEIPPENMAPISGNSAEPVHYRLCGVLYHHGASAGSGHYTVDVLHPNGDSGSGEHWLHIDDETVSAVRQEDVFVGSDNEGADDRCAYMLFYCRTATAWTL